MLIKINEYLLQFIATPNQEKVEEVGRIIYQNGNITVNVGAILAVATLALLGKSPQFVLSHLTLLVWGECAHTFF